MAILCNAADADLQGYHISAIGQNILDTLHLTTTEEKERLLSTVYKELHPNNIVSQSLETLLGKMYIMIHCQP